MILKRTLLFLACLALLGSVAWGLPNQVGKMQSSNQALTFDTETFLDVNSLLCFVYNNGNFCYDNASVLGKTDGLYFPRGTKKTVIYAAGIWIGAKVDGELRVVVAEYGSEFVPGPMSDGTYMADNPAFRVYKVNRGDDDSNLDYANWPADQGAPVNEDGTPAILGDQMCWSVFNDANPATHSIDAGSSDPLGLEIKHSTFAFGRSGSLGQVIFFRYIITNKGSNTLEDTYIALWADPDLGDASDDLVGCDTVLSLGYCYNDAGGDAIYGAGPPAVGFDFFQGPVVDGDPGDSAKFMFEWIQGKKNLPMTSFNKYINGTDPHSPVEAYNYMQGLEIDGDPQVDPDGDTTTFVHAGDPVTNTGWLDDASADRRFMMTTGPFTMAPGDTQEVVAAICVGQGGDRLKSISALKTVDEQAQIVFDLNFKIPFPPPNPIVHARGYDGAIDLIWSPADVDSNWPEAHFQDFIETLGEFYIFEGYNIYQGESPAGPWNRIATIDQTAGEALHTFTQAVPPLVVEGDTVERPWNFQLIYGDVVNSVKGGIETVIQQVGSEAGIVNHMYMERSPLDGAPIVNHRPYYFAVTPYSVNVQEVLAEDSVFSGATFLGFNAANLENTIKPITVIPKGSGAVLVDTATHVSGTSQGMVVVEYLNYTDTEPTDYAVDFNADGSWNLLREGTEVLSNQDNQSGGYDYRVVDGLMVRVMGPDPGILSIQETATASGPLESGDNVFWSLNSTGDYYVSSDLSGSGDDARARFNWRGKMVWESWEFRFTDQGSEYYDWLTDEKWADRAPFEIWHYSEDAEEPDRRDIFFIIDDDGSGGWSYGDRMYISETEYPAEPLPQSAGGTGYVWDDDFHLGRVVFNDFSGALTAPETGTIVEFQSTIPNTANDRFEFTTKPTGSTDGTVVARTLDNVRVVPNPYYNFNPLETDQFDRIIKFTNLPPTECTIKIFNVAGDLVRTLKKTDIASSEFVWDVKTHNGLFVASGIYVYYIEAEGIGDTFGKLVVYTEVEQLNIF